MKRLVITLLGALLLPVVLHAQYTFTNINGALTITSFTGAGAVIIPSTTNGLPITSIGDGSFNDNFNLTSVVIPSSITNIGEGAFSDCDSMTSVNIGTNVLDIGSYAFQYCSRLGNVVIPASVTNIGVEAFAGCTILTNLTVVGPSLAYSSLNGVLFSQDGSTLVIYPQDIAGAYDFPGSVTNIEDYAFNQCSKLTSVTTDNNLLNIGESAFSGCYSMTNIMLSTNLTNISDAAFAFCTNLSSIAIPASVTNIQFGAFAECFSLTNCTVASQNPAYSSVNGVVFDKNQVTLIVCPAGLAGFYVIPGSVTSIDEGAFAYCTRLWSVSFPGSVTNIGIQAFYNCSILTNAPFPSNLISIGASAFYDCAKLQGLSIGNSVTSIGMAAFGGCSSLTNAAIGNGVISLGDYAFEYCTSLRNASIGNTVTNIGVSEFQNCSSLTSVTVDQNVASIGGLAFANCTSLTNLTFLGNAPGIPGTFAFNNIDPAVKVYYQAGTTGWGTSYGGTFGAPVNVSAGILPTVMVGNAGPQISGGSAGIFTNEFGFTIAGASNAVVVVQASSDLLNWTPIATNTLNGTSFIFEDANWRNFTHRFYRLVGQ
jgi:hypothetical protein